MGAYLFQGSRKHHMSDTSGGAALEAREEAPWLRGAGPAGAGSCPPWGTGPRHPTAATASWEGARSSWGRRPSVVEGDGGAWETTSARESGPGVGKPGWCGERGGGGGNSTKSPRSVRKGRYQGGKRRPDPDIMDLHHPGTQPSNILPSRGVETESISKPGLFFAGDLFVFSGDRRGVGDELGSCSPRSHPRGCAVWAGDGVGKQSETCFQEFMRLKGERFAGCRFCNAGLRRKTHPETIRCPGEENNGPR